MMLYTFDEEYGEISVGADILFTNSLDGVASICNNDGNAGLKIIGWEEGNFGDCWVKMTRKPELDADGHAEIDGIKCNVSFPGFHPGGNFYWLTPVDPVMIPVFEDDGDDAA